MPKKMFSNVRGTTKKWKARKLKNEKRWARLHGNVKKQIIYKGNKAMYGLFSKHKMKKGEKIVYLMGEQKRETDDAMEWVMPVGSDKYIADVSAKGFFWAVSKVVLCANRV